MARIVRIPVLVLVAVVSFAGCGEPGRPATVGDDDGEPADQQLLLPAWSLRDFWVYEVNGERATYVVTQDLGTAWQMDTDSDARAFQNAVDDISRLGAQRKADLAGSQGDDTIAFFQWPLTAGESWTTTWDAVPLTITVLSSTPDGADLEGRAANGSLVYTYRYDAVAEWFGELVHWNPDGSEMVRLRLAEFGHNWTGSVVRWAVSQGPERYGPPPVRDLLEFDVPEGATDIWVWYSFDCETGGLVEFNVAPFEDEGRGTTAPCDAVEFEGPFVENPLPGRWGLTAIVAGSAGTADYQILVRTRAVIPVGP